MENFALFEQNFPQKRYLRASFGAEGSKRRSILASLEAKIDLVFGDFWRRKLRNLWFRPIFRKLRLELRQFLPHKN